MPGTNNIQRILVLAPHPDDGEFGAGASLAKWIEEGKEVQYLAFSPCNKSLPKEFEPGTLYKELNNATAALGLKAGSVHTHDFPVRELPKYRQEILEGMVALNRSYKPDLVLCPNADDVHQDHHTIYKEAVRAFKFSSIIGYELPWNNLHFKTNFHVVVNEAQVLKKVAAVNCYESQGFRTYKDEKFLKSWANMRGIQVKSEYAEAFELIRWIDR